jgi:hypothetical protein
LDDLLSANAREENPAAALLPQLNTFYPDLGLHVVAGDAGFGYYSFLHATYQRGAKRVVDLRAHPTDKDKAQWTTRGYDDKGDIYPKSCTSRYCVKLTSSGKCAIIEIAQRRQIGKAILGEIQVPSGHRVTDW